MPNSEQDFLSSSDRLKRPKKGHYWKSRAAPSVNKGTHGHTDETRISVARVTPSRALSSPCLVGLFMTVAIPRG